MIVEQELNGAQDEAEKTTGGERRAQRIRPPVKWHGGKHHLASWIIRQFPQDYRTRTYVEPYGGAASVLLNKDPSPVEVYNDLDERIFRLFRVLRDQPEALLRRLSLTLYSQVEFEAATESTTDEVEQAARDFIRRRLSFGGQGGSFAKTTHRIRRRMADNVSGFLSTVDDQLPNVIERLRTVQILRRPAIEVIQKYDIADGEAGKGRSTSSYTTGVLFYLDPPYLHATRAPGCHNIYGVEMVEDDHRAMAEVLNACKGKVVLSGYPSPLYDELFRGWRTVAKEVANNAAGGRTKRKMTETLWLNY